MIRLKKWSTWLWLGLVAIGGLVVALLRRRPVRPVITEVRDELEDARRIAVIESTAARSKESKAKEQLKEIKKIDDSVERREALARLYRDLMIVVLVVWPSAAQALPRADLEAWLSPPPPPVECDERTSSFPLENVPVRENQTVWVRRDGKIVEWTVRPGFLMSECDLLKTVNLRLERDRLATENRVLVELRQRESAAWSTLLEREESWFERHALILGFVAGAVTMGAATVGTVVIAR